jgi:hypothetical protein
MWDARIDITTPATKRRRGLMLRLRQRDRPQSRRPREEHRLNKRGEWKLSRAVDVAYSYDPTGAWTSRHQMSINGKRDGLVQDDLVALARSGDVKASKSRRDSRGGAGGRRGRCTFGSFAAEAGVDDPTAEKIGNAQRGLTVLRRKA